MKIDDFEILDEPIDEKPLYDFGSISKVGLGFIAIYGLYLQMSAIFYESPPRFDGVSDLPPPVYFRWRLHILCIIGTFLIIRTLRKNGWKFPLKYFDIAIMLGVPLLLLMDQVVIRFEHVWW